MAKINTQKQSYIVGWVGLKLADDYFITHSLRKPTNSWVRQCLLLSGVSTSQSSGLISCYVNATIISKHFLSYPVIFFTMYRELALILKLKSNLLLANVVLNLYENEFCMKLYNWLVSNKPCSKSICIATTSLQIYSVRLIKG